MSKNKSKPRAKVKDKPTNDKVNIPRSGYKATRSSSGGKSLNNGDQIATLLDGLDGGEVQQIADKIFPSNDFKTAYAHLNPGMARMNIGNRLRKFAKESGANLKKITTAAGPLKKAAAARVAAEKAVKTKKAA